jgi:hypothetical protein
MSDLYIKYKNTRNPHIFELILQWYLITVSFRSLALLYVHANCLQKVADFATTHDIPFVIVDVYFLIYDKNKVDPQKLLVNRSNGEFNYIKTAHMLGSFYTCASNKFTSKEHNQRIVILFGDTEIYAQQCKPNQIREGFNTIYKIFTELKKTFL